MGKVCVLVAEDHEDFLNLLEMVLSSEGFYVARAPDGQKAIDLLEHVRPMAIVTDIMMPDVDGITLIRHVRGTPDLADIPIIAMSGARSASLDEAMKAGATASLSKPVDPCEVVQVIRGYITKGNLDV
jgi:CheY-like chemotaxis protein